MAERPMPAMEKLPKCSAAPPIPVVSVTEMMTTLRAESSFTLLCRRLEMPAPAIVPKSSSMMPPRMAWSMLRSSALTFPMREKMMPVSAAMRKTTGSVTFVSDMAPVTSE